MHAQAQASHNHNSSDDNWDSFNDGGFPDGFDDIEPNLPSEGGDVNNAETDDRKRDWLTSISQPLGQTATTLEAIEQFGSFPPDSNSPEFHFHEAQHPGHGAKCLAAKAFGVTPMNTVTNEEAEFHLRMTKFLNCLTKTEQEDPACCLLHVHNARDDSLNIFKTTRPPQFDTRLP